MEGRVNGKHDEPTLLEFCYGSSTNVNKDVDLFKGFYLEYFQEEALGKIVARTRKRALIGGLVLCLVAVLFVAPMIINPASIFAKIILAMGVVLLAAGLASFGMAMRAEAYATNRFERLMESEFTSTRSGTRRVFNIYFSGGSVTVSFGAQSSVKQVRTKRYEDIPAVYETAELVFIKGLTWLSRFQMGDEAFGAVCNVLKEKCSDRYFSCSSPVTA